MSQTEIAHPKIVSQEEWLAERLKLLDEEKDLTRQYDKIAAKRRRLPMVKLEKEYLFDSPEGKKSLKDLFEDKIQLIVYHFMFDPEWEEGCTGCTGFVDAIGDISMLGERNTRFVLISRAPQQKLDEYKRKHGWSIPWYSSFGSEFNYDFHVTLDENITPVEYNFKDKEELLKTRKELPKGEAPGVTVFFRVGDEIYHAYSAYGRGVELLTDCYTMLDVTPYGRQEDFEDSPAGWPQKPTYG